ncbi:hypothetical protein [uncultured Kordia sp.]|uniref:hypothetical protein n=1 Tax=uncultured Kordia sp. TaxID=507699 RepID=UPI0026150000|nr:hypothetical protein [uncultured Kordia sp.]
MFFKSNRPFAERGILFAILLGIVSYLVFAGIMYTNIKPTYTAYKSIEKANLMVDSTYTNVGIPFKEHYLQDLANIDKADTEKVILVDNIERPNHFYKKSRLFENLLFSSENESYLHFTISGLDLKYAKVLGKNDIPNPYFLNSNPKMALWILLISIAVGFTFFLSPLFYAEIRRYNKDLSIGIRVGNIIFAVIVFAFLVIPLFMPSIIFPGILIKPTDVSIYFDTGFESFAIMYGATVPFVCTIFWLILIFTVNSKISQLYTSNSEKLLTRFKAIKDDVERYFLVIAFFLAFTIFCTDTLLSTLNALGPDAPTLFPREFAFSNGLIQTFFLVLIYFGIQANFSRIKKGIQLNDSITPEDKENLKEHAGFFNYVKVILTMLAPLLGSGIQDLIGLISGGA